MLKGGDIKTLINEDLPESGNLGVPNAASIGVYNPTIEKFREYVRHTNRQSLMPDHIRVGADSYDSINESDGGPEHDEERRVLLSRKDNLFAYSKRTRNGMSPTREGQGADSILTEYSAD